ncbi:unnamed protein product [Linum tenue]|uniref:Protein FAR1-RELATED SEQUENCE n=4 Tax=Linum tenue TaxID=586396 RepID=A0AAV0HG05_9ROSI|nr:unnamed protein product [Linum tenue]
MSTNRVESSHSSLKSWINTSRHKIDSLFMRFHACVEGRVIELRKDLEESRLKVFTWAYGPPFVHLNNKVSSWAIELLRGEGSRKNVERCGCVLPETYGLPCLCTMQRFSNNGLELYPHHLHRFWSSLNYHDPPDRAQWEDHDAIESDIFDQMVEKVRCRGPNLIRAAIPSLRAHVLPEDMGLLEPRDAEIPRGRPPRRENARKRSWVEHERSREARRSNTTRTSPPMRDPTPPMSDPTPPTRSKHTG